MADFTAVTSARVAAGACIRLTREIILLCSEESWRVFPIIGRGIRKVQPFFSEVLDGVAVKGITEQHLGVLQDLEDALSHLEALLKPRKQQSRVLKLLSSVEFAEKLQDACLHTSDVLESVVVEDFLVPSDVVDDVAAVARTLRDLNLEEPLAEADAVARMHEQMKAMQSSWQTSSVHETLRKLLLEQGIAIPCTSSEIEPELDRLKAELHELEREKREEETFLFTHIVALYTLRQGEVCQGQLEHRGGEASPTSVLDDDAYMQPLYRSTHSGQQRSGSPPPETPSPSGYGRPSSPQPAPGSSLNRPRSVLKANFATTSRPNTPSRLRPQNGGHLHASSEAGNSSRGGSEAESSLGGIGERLGSALSPTRSVPNLKMSRVGDGGRMLFGVKSANDVLQKEASLSEVASAAALRGPPGKTRSQDDLSRAAGRPALRAQSSATSIGSSAATAASMLNVENFLTCPLTKEVMRDPVILVESGHTYERRAIQAWLKAGNKVCPATGKQLRNKHLVPNIRLKQGVDDFHSARLAVLSAESSYTNSNLDKIVEWVKMLNSGNSVDQQIALSSLVDSSLDKRDLANFLAMDGVSALMKIMSHGTPSSRGFVVRVMWLHLLDFPEGRLEVIRANGLPRVCELICSEVALSNVVKETMMRCLKAMAFTPALRAEARKFGVVVKLLGLFRLKKQPVSVRKVAASTLTALMIGQPEAREEVIQGNGIPVLIEQLDEFAAGRDDALRLEALAALSQVLWNEKARRIITSRGYLKDICSLLQAGPYSFKFGVASICRLMSLEADSALEIGQLGAIPSLAQLVLKCSTTSTVWPVAAATLCNMARQPMLRRIILRAGIRLERNLVGRTPPAGTPRGDGNGGGVEVAGGAASGVGKEEGEAPASARPSEAEVAGSSAPAQGSESTPLFPESADDEWMITYKGGHAVADKPVVR